MEAKWKGTRTCSADVADAVRLRRLLLWAGLRGCHPSTHVPCRTLLTFQVPVLSVSSMPVGGN
jgi:hypothetical protein